MFQKAMKCFGHEAKSAGVAGTPISQTVNENQMVEATMVHVINYAPPNPQQTAVAFAPGHTAVYHDLITAVVLTAIERSDERERHQRTLVQAQENDAFYKSSMLNILTHDKQY
ncbi:hypothetical protein NEOLI_002967 [Neolecta irregularis DAH-3]|uniref:Uncharacterized protein n=1 Tax=Neolecta irregularis (strain DAH-3) TaxID=1198029 RepID=A0A1U7LSM6_NEOID|nr:hypothetical protein NEOLI_002967 [Neolecta irregularis DAH-3]|eukprot:OLL25629.1 hypothetical protein NEOLI_002967 [Neolecta irregularis DAH-3]